ncbi:MAG: flagellar assembly protein FliX [Rhodospirillales bacterium]
MAGIEGVGSVRPTTARMTSGARGPSGFAVRESESRVGWIAAPAALGGLLGLQETIDDRDGDAPARQQADTLLTELAALQRTLLGGGDPSTVLDRLDGTLSAIPSGGSPALLALLGAVRTRARVELARRAGGENR